MAVVNIKSTAVQNADAAVQTLNPVYFAGAKKYSLIVNAAIAAADDDGSVMRLARVHSSWRIVSLRLFNEAIAAGAWGLTLYQIAANGGAAVAANLYGGPAIDLATAHVATPLELIGSNATRTLDKMGQAVWQDAGLTADPNLWYDLAFTCATAGTAAGKVALEVEYIAGSS